MLKEVIKGLFTDVVDIGINGATGSLISLIALSRAEAGTRQIKEELQNQNVELEKFRIFIGLELDDLKNNDKLRTVIIELLKRDTEEIKRMMTNLGNQINELKKGQLALNEKHDTTHGMLNTIIEGKKDRKFTIEQIELIQGNLAIYDTQDFEILVGVGNSEGMQLAEQIEQILIDINWNCVGIMKANIFSHQEKSFCLGVPEKYKNEKWFQAMVIFCNELNVKGEMFLTGSNHVLFTIGMK